MDFRRFEADTYNLICFHCENTQSAGARQWNFDSLRSHLAMQIGYFLRSRILNYKISVFASASARIHKIITIP